MSYLPVVPDNTTLYPAPEDVFLDTSLEAFFKPLLSYKHSGKTIHLLSTDGLYTENISKYAEHSFWGFRYEDMKYSFLGDLSVFGQSNIPEVYKYIKTDFEANKERYLTERTSHKAYWEAIEDALSDIADFEDYQDIQDYAESCYSYLLSKYNYEKTGNFCYIMELVANFHHDENEIMLDDGSKSSILEEFFINLKYHLKYDYGLSKQMAVCAAEGFRFTRYGGISFAFLDDANDIVYIMEYHT